MYLSFTGDTALSECPKQYWHIYIDRTQIPPQNCVNSLYGSTVGTLFEHFYNDKIWMRRNYLDILISRAAEVLDSVIAKQRNSKVDWLEESANYHSREELLADVRETIPRGIQIIREHRFIGPKAEAEVDLDQTYPSKEHGSHKIGGRADFVIQRAHYQDLVIIDGKGSRHGMKYLKPKQVLLYSMLYRDKFGVTPNAAGFLLWKFSGDKAVNWIPFSNKDLDQLKREVLGNMDLTEKKIKRLNVLSGMPKAYQEFREEAFPAQPAFKCNLCSYAHICEEGQKKVKAKKLDTSFSKKTRLTDAELEDML